MGNTKQFIDDMTVITISLPVSLNKTVKEISADIGVSKSSLIQTYIIRGVRENNIRQKIINKDEELKIKPTIPTYEVITNKIMDEAIEKYKDKFTKMISSKGLRISVEAISPSIMDIIEEECIKQGSEYDKFKNNIKKIIGVRLGELKGDEE